MAGLCGWIRTREDAQPDLDTMASALPSHGDERGRTTGARHGAFVRSVYPSDGVATIDNWVIALEGAPTFTDSAMMARAAENGVARVLLEEIARNPDRAFSALRGPFSVAAINLLEYEALFAVDRMGRRPLAYAPLPDGVAFASQATALRSVDGVDGRLNPQSAYHYVYFHVVPSPGTIFRGIEKVAPGEIVQVSNGRAHRRRFWRPDFSQRARRPSSPLLPVVRDAVARTGVSETSGAFLSGGLDSSTVAGVLNEQTDEAAKAFTIGFAQEGYDEIEFARTAVRHFNLDHYDHYITGPEVAAAFGEVARAYDEPFGNSSAVPTLICARLAARNGVTDLLAGDGGDELFAGNERYATQKLFGLYQHVPSTLRRSLLEPFFGRASVVRKGRGFQHKVRRYIEQANMSMPGRTQTYNLLHTTPAAEVFDEAFLADVDTEAPLAALAAAYDDGDTADPLDRLLQMDWKFTLADNDLRKVSRMCDLAGVNVHYPLLDDALVDYAISVPSSLKLKRFELRSFYKQETAGFLPAEIINKSKHGFGLPFGEWLRTDDDLRALIGERVDQVKARGVFSERWVDTLLAQHASDHAAFYGNFVWVLAMFEEWCQQHDVVC
ncbi:MAG: asparagine synthase C-terminal domain-containing protein [Pseudomonadota bacterium]